MATLSQIVGAAPKQCAITLQLIARKKALHPVQQNQLTQFFANDLLFMLVNSAW